jgi:hypothetical protein
VYLDPLIRDCDDPNLTNAHQFYYDSYPKRILVLYKPSYSILINHEKLYLQAIRMPPQTPGSRFLLLCSYIH